MKEPQHPHSEDAGQPWTPDRADRARLAIPLDGHHHAEIAAAAESLGLTVAAFIRMAALERARAAVFTIPKDNHP